MFLSFGDPGDLSDLGILSGDGYIDVLPLAPQTVAEKILKRLRLNQSITPPKLPRASGRTVSFHADISSRILKYAPADLIGRAAETKLLTDAWDQAVRGEPKRPHVLTFVALGGEGKTSLVARWAAELAHRGWPGCDAVFAWSFYSQGTREQAVSSDAFLAEALTFFGDAAMAGSAQGAFDKGRRLARLVGERRALLILDGLEPLQYALTSPTPGEVKDQGLAALLKGLAATSLGRRSRDRRRRCRRRSRSGSWRASSPPNGRGLRGGRSKIVPPLPGHTGNLNAMGITPDPFSSRAG